MFAAPLASADISQPFFVLYVPLVILLPENSYFVGFSPYLGNKSESRKLKSVKRSPPPLLSKTVLDTFASHGSSMKQRLSCARQSEN
nr:hypothetical protein [Prochloraceae cyanobacterium]